jgi:hypothetical protein
MERFDHNPGSSRRCQTGRADGSNGVAYFQQEIATVGSTTTTLLLIPQTLSKPRPSPFRSLPTAIVWCLAFDPSSRASLLPADGRLGCWDHHTATWVRPWTCLLRCRTCLNLTTINYAPACISECCLLVGCDNRSKQALPARSPFVAID